MKAISKKTVNTLVFFVLLYCLTIFLLWKNTALLTPFTLKRWLILLAGLTVISAASPFLIPVFDGVTRLTKKLGSLIFALLSLIIFFLILTPIAAVMRMTGTKFLEKTGSGESYYETWESGDSIEKQY